MNSHFSNKECCSKWIPAHDHVIYRTCNDERMQKNKAYNLGFSCDVCRKHFSKEIESWSCSTCNYDICDECSSSEYRKYWVHSHSLRQMTGQQRVKINPGYATGYICNFCKQKRNAQENNWNCGQCNYDLCYNCSNSEFRIIQSHEHPLKLTTGQERNIINKNYQIGYICNSCRVSHSALENNYHCSTCNYDLCLSCSNSEFKNSKHHLHSLKLSTQEDRVKSNPSYANGFICNICRRSGGTFNKNWRCGECNFDVCLSCI